MAPGSGDSEGGKNVPSVGTSITILKAQRTVSLGIFPLSNSEKVCYSFFSFLQLL